MPTTTPIITSPATLDLALHTHLRAGLTIETIGDLRDLLLIADLPDSLPVETLTSGKMVARYCPEIGPTDATPCGGYHAHLDLAGLDDADPEDERPLLSDLLGVIAAHVEALSTETPALEAAA